MDNKYIIKFTNSEKVINAFLEFNTNGNIIRIMNDEGLVQMYISIYNIIETNFNDNERTCIIKYKHITQQMTNKVIFDENSSSAYNEFKKTFETMLNSKKHCEYYPSGNLMYTGDVTNKLDRKIPSGNGKLYYDSPNNYIKYDGNFDDGYFDGSGTFYSSNGKLSLKVNNISSNLPIGNGKFNINFTNKKDTIDINFIEIWDKLNLKTKGDKKTFVTNDNFLDNILKIYIDKNEIDDLLFMELKQEDKNIELLKRIKKLEDNLSNITKQYNKTEQVLYSNNKLLIILMFTQLITFMTLGKVIGFFD